MTYKKIILDAIYHKTGIYITNKYDCRIISQNIVNEKYGYLSESTLYRFFLHPSTTNKPYKNTFNILAQFCGFSSWDGFVNYCEANYLFNESGFLIKTIEVVLFDFIKNNKFDSLIAIFDSLEKHDYKTREFIGLKAFMCFQKTTNFSLFIKKYGQHPFVRNILIEALYDPNHRIPSYNESLEYYLELTDPESKNYIQDFIFTNSVLFRYYYLNNNSKSIDFGKKIYESRFDDNDFNRIYIFPKTRFFAYKIWYLSLINSPSAKIDDYLNFLVDWISNQFNNIYSIIELNIIVQTFTEVAEHQKLTVFLNKINHLYQVRVQIIDNSKIDLGYSKNANGLLNYILK